MIDFNILKIEKDIPVPPHQRDKHPVRVLISTMERGDSIFFPTPVTQQRVYSWYKPERVGSKKFAMRKLEGGMRLWRTE